MEATTKETKTALAVLIGQEIARARLEANLSQDDLAKLLGFANKRVVSAIENGARPTTVLTLATICEVLKLEAFFILRPNPKTEKRPYKKAK